VQTVEVAEAACPMQIQLVQPGQSPVYHQVESEADLLQYVQSLTNSSNNDNMQIVYTIHIKNE
jgi:hypothetical protein